MLGYLIRRISWALITMFLVVNLVFIVFFIVPFGPGYRHGSGYSPLAMMLAGKRVVDRSYMLRLEERLGLGVPLSEQYTTYIGNLARGDLGMDQVHNAPVASQLAKAFPVTIGLMAGSAVLWLAAATFTGLAAAERRGSRTDRSLTVTSSVTQALPVFVSGLLLLKFLRDRGLYAFGSYTPLSGGLIAYGRAMWLPWLVVATSFFGRYHRLIRSGVAAVEKEEFMISAEAKGLKPATLRRRALRTTSIPVLTLLGLDIGTVMGAAILVEPVFGLPGLGALAVEGITGLNFPLVAGVTLAGSALAIAASLIVDVLYGLADPRVAAP